MNIINNINNLIISDIEENNCASKKSFKIIWDIKWY